MASDSGAAARRSPQSARAAGPVEFQVHDQGQGMGGLQNSDRRDRAGRTLQASEPTGSFITAIVTQNGIASDKPGLTEVLAEQASMGLDAPSVLYVDGTYVSSQALKEAEEQGRQLRGPAPAAPERGKTFTAEAFDVAVAGRRAVCPAGQCSTNCSRLEEAKTSKVNYRFEWNDALCGACPKAHGVFRCHAVTSHARGR